MDLDTIENASKLRVVCWSNVYAVRRISLNYSPKYHPQFIIVEALSATGLRPIRYAKEIPLVRFVMEANQPLVL